MDKNNSAKQNSKKIQMGTEKSKKSAGKKKKKNKKTKNDQSPDILEVEGVQALEQTEPESDCSLSRQAGSGVGSTDSPVSGHRPSPVQSAKSSIQPEASSTNNAIPTQNNPTDNDLSNKTKSSILISARKSSVDTPVSGTLKHTQSASVLSTSEHVLRKNTVSFSNLDEIQSVSTSLSTMSVKSKNASQRGKTKTGTKTTSSGATKREREKTMKIDPQKSAINKAAEEAARIRSEESLRWEFKLDDEDQEMERLRIYKINRRKRYLAAAQEKGLGWVVNYGNNGSPLADESLTDVNEREPISTNVTDFSPVRSILTSQRNTPMNIGGEIAC
ncbi:immunoglobulin A1 protease autotransporter-like [Mercenaria mercenaria]|uniref:immunoglobulin A1 protease autotransporter-like n=1 Tax=Mercenaria mercenaria TaxID=6596 RepID=UPI00234F9913|nr:immunoglobulin A1 protease autotransporter-like [Mercenaria mercenaria]